MSAPAQEPSRLSTIYRLSPAATQRDTNRILLRSLSFTLICMLIPMFMMLFAGQLSDSKLMTFLALYGVVLAVVIGLTIRRTRRVMKNAIETFELTIDDLQITRTQRECPTMVIPRGDIKRISERAGQGFRIETAKTSQNIWVPRELEGYEEVKLLLLSNAAEQPKTIRHPLAITYGSSLIFVAGLLIVMYSQRKLVVTTTGAACLGFYVYYVFQLKRSWPNLSRTMKRALLVSLLPVLFVASRIISMWR
jgi:hypothetical protein